MDNLREIFTQIIKDAGIGLKGYLKAQIMLMGITFIILLSVFTFLNTPYSLLISFIISIIDALPILGSGLILVPWSIFNYVWGNRYLGIALGILYFLLLIIRQILEPMLMGKAIGIKPSYTFSATVIGTMVLGPLGILVGPLLIVVINSIIKTKKSIDSRK